MTRLLFLPDPDTLLWLESPLPEHDLVLDIQSGHWMPPDPYSNLVGNLDAAAQNGIVTVSVRREPVDRRPMLRLNRRQQEVLKGIAEGLTTRQMAVRLRLSTRTVNYYIAELKQRFDAPNRAALIAEAALYLKSIQR